MAGTIGPSEAHRINQPCRQSEPPRCDTRMIEIILNGTAQQVPENLSLLELLELNGLVERRLAVEHNLQVIARSELATRRLQSGDRLEIVHAIGGG
ncbi:Thiamine biosynthesis protein ThiS (Modular protein) [Pseudomonas marincola]|uniref:Thiamine biosynthesis protein ThiS (Modular protein) n=1 Tax=Pseudomonas marincola TaxID=437900 RepID=A0A1I7DE73_9PSED|nr:Thiamine biosynthesis protein ThiS (Modular protein) [Pseudomonas marincola]SFU09978.1 thiazole synthase [Pseudomonas marincola]